MNPPNPVTFEADFDPDRSRATTFFRTLMCFPAMLVLAIMSLGIYLTLPISWLALMFTGRYPQGLYRYHARIVASAARIQAYYHLLTDTWPPVGLDGGEGYPVRVEIGPAQESYSRAKVFFRFLIGIPVIVMLYIYGIGLFFVRFVAKWRIVFTGHQSAESHSTMTRWLRYMTRAQAYFMYLTDVAPRISEDAATATAPAPTP